MLDIERTLAGRRQQRPLVAIEIGERHLRAPQNRLQRRRERAILGEEGQQHQSGQRCVGGKMREPRGDDRLRRFALDKRHAERTVGMRQADEQRQVETVAALLDARRKEAEQPARARCRPDQQRAGIGREHRRGGQRKGRLIEDVGLERARGKLAPFGHDRRKLGEDPPFDREGIRRIAVGEDGAARTGDRRSRAIERRDRRFRGRDF